MSNGNGHKPKINEPHIILKEFMRAKRTQARPAVTQSAMATRLGISRISYIAWESCAKDACRRLPTEKSLKIFAEFLNSRLRAKSRINLEELRAMFLEAQNYLRNPVANKGGRPRKTTQANEDTLGSLMAQICQKSKLLQSEVALAMGIPQSRLSKIEQNKKLPTLQQLTKFAEICSVGDEDFRKLIDAYVVAFQNPAFKKKPPGRPRKNPVPS